jgi:hypothetical protein
MASRHGFKTTCVNCDAEGELRWKENDQPYSNCWENLIQHDNLIVAEHWRSEPDWRGHVICAVCHATLLKTDKP